MRSLNMLIVVLVAACGGGSSKPSIDAPRPDAAAPDAKVFMDAPAGGMDFSCYNAQAPATADNPITVAGTTTELSTGGAMAAGMVTVAAYKTGSGTVLSTVTSNAQGVFTTGNLTTGGVPLNGYLKASKGTTYRTTYLYPPNPLAKNLTEAPVIMVTDATFGTVALVAGFSQDDSTNGALVVTVADCKLNPLTGATLSVKQGGTEVGDKYDLSQLSPMAAGFFIVFNVPDGATQISATYQSMSFPAHTVMSHKSAGGLGTVTVSAVQPGFTQQ
jgi:hypothetical protein